MSKTFRSAFSRCMICATVLLAALPTAAFAESSISVVVNGQTVNSSASYLSDSGQSIVDVDAYVKAIAGTYTFDEAKSSITINGKQVDVTVKDGVKLASVRSLADATGAGHIDWNASSQTVLVSYDQKLVVFGDTVYSEGGCIPQNRFTVGDSIIFRMTAQNPITGQIEKDAKLQVQLSTGEKIDMVLSTHPPGVPNAPEFWTGKYTVSDKTPKGILNYSVTAETATAKGEFRPFNVPPSLITIVEPDSAGTKAPAEQPAAK